MKILLRRLLPFFLGLVVLIALFYAEEDWRGKRAWENCKRELEARGEVLDWKAYIPPPVPDDQNFFKAPNMADWFVTRRAFIAENKTNELSQHLDPKYPFEVARRNGSNGPVVVAELFFSAPTSAETGLRFNDPAARAQIHRLIEDAIGQGANGAQGLSLTAKTLNQIKPEQIRIQATQIPSANEVAIFLHVADMATNVGRLRVETGIDTKSFQVSLVPLDSISAADYLAWNKQAEAGFDLIREALKRPYTRMDGDYTRPFEIPIPNFVMTRVLAQTLDQRTKCYLLLGQPEKALREVTLLNDSRRMLESAPTGKPMLLVDSMIDVAITGLYVNTIADGLQKHAWQEPQLAALQEQLREINLPQLVVESFNTERAASTYTLETTSVYKIADLLSGVGFSADKNKISTFRLRLKNPMYLLILSAPRGWVYQNMVTDAELLQNEIHAVDTANQLISPRAVNHVMDDMDTSFGHASPYSYIAAIMIPNFIKAWQTAARNQTLVNEGQIACALERYRLAHREYPETLDALVPQFIEKLPHDIIGGPPSQGSGAASQPLHYRRTDDGKFLLYSVGWNEKDDGGQVALKADGSVDLEKGDWVWKSRAGNIQLPTLSTQHPILGRLRTFNHWMFDVEG
jgi:hypothetical protein